MELKCRGGKELCPMFLVVEGVLQFTGEEAGGGKGGKLDNQCFGGGGVGRWPP